MGNLLKLKWQVFALYSLSISMVLKVLKLCSFSCVEAMPRLEKDVKLIYRLCIYSIIHPIKLLKNMHESMFSWNNINSKMVSKKEMNMHLICSGCFLILKKMRKYHRHTVQQLIIPFERLRNIQRYYATIIKSIKHNRKDMKQNFNTQQFCVIKEIHF